LEYHSRKQPRLEGFDYSSNGTYFITICTKDKRCILGSCVGGGVLDAPQIVLSKEGQITKKYIHELSRFYPNLHVDKYVIMPNHLHILLSINGDNGTSRTPSPTNAVIPRTVSTLKRFIHKDCGAAIFQRCYHDHIVRCEEDYRRVWEYIDTNPQKWQEDKYFASN
jgi:REP element-mobilizing transposase RayT